MHGIPYGLRIVPNVRCLPVNQQTSGCRSKYEMSLRERTKGNNIAVPHIQSFHLTTEPFSEFSSQREIHAHRKAEVLQIHRNIWR